MFRIASTFEPMMRTQVIPRLVKSELEIGILFIAGGIALALWAIYFAAVLGIPFTSATGYNALQMVYIGSFLTMIGACVILA